MGEIVNINNTNVLEKVSEENTDCEYVNCHCTHFLVSDIFDINFYS